MSKRSNALVIIFAVLYACAPDTPTGPPAVENAKGRAAATEPPAGPVVTAYGPEKFTRHPGAPDKYSRTINLSRFEGPFTLRITNGSPSGDNRVKNGEVAVNGETVLTKKDVFNLTGEFVRTYVGGITALEVTLYDAPDAFLTISIEAHERRWRVCPDENFYRTYGTVQEAVAAADPGATIWVCDGTHDAAAVVNKPLTIRSEHSGGATLRDTLVWSATQVTPNAGGTQPVFWVDGISSGTFRIADINFQLRQSAINTTGTWDRVEMDSVNITALDSAHVFAVRSFPSTVAGARFDVKHTTFSHLSNGVFAFGGIVNVSNSRFTGLGRPVIYGEKFTEPMTGALGLVDHNVFNGCGPQGCVRIDGRGGVTIASNTLAPEVGGPSSVAILVFSQQLNLPTLTTILEDNDITGPAPLDRATQLSWALQGGVQYLTSAPVPSSLVIRGNRISNVARGIATNTLNGSTLEAHDNIITNTFEGVRRQGNGPIIFTRNDVTNSVRSFGDFFGSTSGPSSRDYKCNWWGSANGPVGVEGAPAPPSSIFAPWATAPIAGTSITCDPVSPSLVVACETAASGGPITVPTVQAAYNLVSTGGTVLICDGTHSVQDVRISKAVTIRAQGPGKPMLDAGGKRMNLDIRDVVGGPVVIRGLRMRGTWLVTSPLNGYGANINIEGTYDAITIEDSEFYPSGQPVAYEVPGPGQPAFSYNSGVSAGPATGNEIIVRNSTFSGGDMGVRSGGSNLRIEGNTFRTQSNAAIAGGGRGTAIITNNDISECGTARCIAIFGQSDITVSNNRLIVDFTRQTAKAIVVDAPRVQVLANTITGIGGSRTGLDASTFPIKQSGIEAHVADHAQNTGTAYATVAGNHISGAYSGMDFVVINPGALSAVAHDNVVSSIASPFSVGGIPGSISLTMTRNDFTSYAVSYLGQVFTPVDLRCNWWGRTAGPAGIVPAYIQVSAQPWSIQPIAGRPEVVCP